MSAGRQGIATFIDRVSIATGHAASWLTLLMVVFTFVIVVLRYAFDTGAIWLQESVTWMHAAVFMLGAAYTLQQDGHVRVDIFYQRFSRRGRAWVDLLGTLILLVPICLFVLASSWHYVAESWAVHEGSREAGGLPYVYLLKTLQVIMPVLVLIQGAVWMLRNGLFLAGVEAALPAVSIEMSEHEGPPGGGDA